MTQFIDAAALRVSDGDNDTLKVSEQFGCLRHNILHCNSAALQDVFRCCGLSMPQLFFNYLFYLIEVSVMRTSP